MKWLLGLIFFWTAFGVVTFGAPLTVSWVEGTVDVRSGTTWAELDVGDTVDSAASVRLGPGSFAEFLLGTRKISLSAAGTYKLESLVSSTASHQSSRISIVDKMGRFVNNQAPRSTVVAGVRGAFEGGQEKATWVVDEDDPETLAEAGRVLVSQKHYAEAAAKFASASEGALGDKRDEYLYSQAWCLAASDDAIGAIKILRPMPASGAYGIPRGILLAQLNLDTGAVGEATAVLEEISRNPSLEGDDAATVAALKAAAQTSAVGAP